MTRNPTNSITHDEDAIVDLAIGFAYGSAIDNRSVKRVCSAFGIEWPRREYVLQSDGETVCLKAVPLRPRQIWKEVKALRAIKDSLVISLKHVSRLSAGESVSMITSSVDRVREIAQMVETRSGRLPADVLSTYAIALLADPALRWHKHVKLCKYCHQVFIAPKTGGRRPDRHDDCQKPWRNAYMTPERRKGKANSK